MMSESQHSDSPGGRGLTYADYAALPDDGHRYQLVEGELVVTPSPTRWHQEVIGTMYRQLSEHVQRLNLGQVFIAPLDVLLSDRVVLQPDLFFVSNERAAIVRDANIAGAPDLCIEVLSPGTERLDRLRKTELYARFGVPHYWIIDLSARSIEEHVLGRELYRVRSIAGNDDEFRPAAFPGFVFRLAPIGLPATQES
jgi:Uma2 family endonuclease